MRLKTRDNRVRLLLGICGAAAIAAPLPVLADDQPGVTTQPQDRTIVIGAPPSAQPALPQRLNPTGRAITLTVPAKDGAFYLGDVVITISAEDEVTFSSARILDLLSNIVETAALEAMRGAVAGQNTVSADDFMPAGLRVSYNPQTLELDILVPSQLRAAQGLSVASMDRARFGAYVEPASFSAYLNVRGNVDYVHHGVVDGFGDPVFFLDGATRFGGVVFETQGVWAPENPIAEFQRQGSRFVYDDIDSVARYTLGDLQPVARGYQSAPSMAGVSILRSYSQLQPQRIARPRGERSFTLERPSTVEIYINGQMLRRLQLQPGNYNLSDFPFTQGANDVRLSIIDDTGRTEVLRFNVFIDQTQLAQGLAEFGLFAGAKTTLQADGPDYSDDWTVSGFYRRGVTDALTLGGNFQADEFSYMAGLEAVAGTAFGTFGAQVAVSDIRGVDSGHALTVTYQRLIQRTGGRADSFSASYQYRSEFFAPSGVLFPSNPFEYEIGAGYSHAFGDDIYAGLDLHFSKGRGATPDFANYRGTVGWRLTPSISLTADVLYEDGVNGENVAGLISLTQRLGRYSTARADYDTRGDRTRLSYQTLRGQGVNSFTAAVDVEQSNASSGVNGILNFVGNRGEVGLSHFGVFDSGFGSTLDERTSLRFGTSLAVADGAFSMGRPIFDSFAVVKPHRTLGGAEVLVNPTPNGYIASSGWLGAATAPNLPSYAEQTLTVDAPEAPVGVDLGQGSFRVFPPYRSGYRLTVGSDYYVTAVGVMLGADGEPLSLIAGTASELGVAGREPLTVFTNRDGRFGITGLKPGRWRIDMLGDDPATYFIDVPESAEGVLRLNTIRPAEGN